MQHDVFIQNLRRKHYTVSFFPTGREAADYLCSSIQNTTVGFGDSETLLQMDLARRLSERNTVLDPQPYTGQQFLDVAKSALTTDVFLTSVNAAAESGELVNMDSTGNRVAGSLFGHKKVYFVFSVKKVEPTLEQAIWRVRNVAAPQNAKRFGFSTPCAVKGDRCYDCDSPDRICNTLVIYQRKEKSVEAEVVLIGEDLGL